MMNNSTFIRSAMVSIVLFGLQPLAFSQAVWTKLSEADFFSNSFHDVQFVDGMEGWAIGRSGKIAHTNDRGNTWRAQTSGTSKNLNGVYFLSNRTGWVVGEGGAILSTDDGGESWQPQESNISNTLNKIFFMNANAGWAVGSSGTIIQTSDGGSTWQGQASGISRNLNGVHFIDANQGWAVGDGGNILFTSDAGNDWQKKTSGTGEDLDAVFFADANHGWIVGNGSNGGTILHTSDSGQSWRTQSTGINRILWLHDLHFVDNQNGWIVGENSVQISQSTSRITGYVVLRTNDGGASWEPQIETTARSFFTGEYIVSFSRAIHFVSNLEGWVVGQSGRLIHTTDGGQTWRSDNFRRNLNGIQFVSAQDGWAAGSNGIILKSNDGGLTWERIDIEFPEDFFGVYFLSAQEGWIFGDNYSILYTEDAGATWTTQYDENNRSRAIHSMSFISDSVGWAVGNDRRVLRTTDKGNSWQAVQIPSNVAGRNYSRVQFVSPTHGWMADNSVILKTTDSGLAWERFRVEGNQNQFYSINSFYFSDSSNGWAIGQEGVVLKSIDGGENWQAQNTGTFADLADVLFVNNHEGWAVGGNGTILHTIDGGVRWEQQESQTGNKLSALSFASETFLWAAGLDGIVLKYEDQLLPIQPRAVFSVTPEFGTISTVFSVDATLSYDNQDNNADLQVRWDWEDDGTFDTAFNTEKTASHRYFSVGPKRIRMEVQDSNGLLGTTTRVIGIPAVVSNTPGADSPVFHQGSEITATFGVEIEPSTINDSTFVITGSQSGPQSGSINYNAASKQAVFQPSAGFMSGEEVTATLSNAIKTSDGMPAGGYTWKFLVAVEIATEGSFADTISYVEESQAKNIICSDLDGDGYTDLIYASGNSGRSTTQVTVRFNNGDGSFSDPLDIDADNARGINAIVAQDFNGDGLVDLAATVFSSNRGIRLFFNQGNRIFPAPVQFQAGAGPEFMDSGDFNNDGHFDLAVANRNDSATSIFLNRGDGTFAEPVQYPVFLRAVKCDDIEGDGDVDLIGLSFDFVILALNNGDGSFDMPQKIESRGGNYQHLFVADLDNDGLRDIAAVDNSNRVIILHNLGNGTFSDEQERTRLRGLSYVTGGDFDGDGDVDLAAANEDDFTTAGTSIEILLNDGTGKFFASTVIQVGIEPNSLCTSDFDNNGTLDLAVANTQSNNVKVLFNSRARLFTRPQAHPLGHSSDIVQPGDVDGDQFDDVIVIGRELSILRNRRNGSFDFPTPVARFDESATALAAKDLDGDNDLDIAVIFNRFNQADQLAVLLNQGDGDYAAPVFYETGDTPVSIFSADFDKDGDNDLAIARNSSSQGRFLTIFSNLSQGLFVEDSSYVLDDRINTVHGSDFDNDGDIDLLVTSSAFSATSKKSVIFFNKGDGTFDPPVDLGVRANTAATIDFDNDGDIDLLFFFSTQVTKLLNHGDGTFADPVVENLGSSIRSPSVGDFDGDGDLDIAGSLGGFTSGALVIARNNGQGQFEAPALYQASFGPEITKASDFDKDGDLDFIVGYRFRKFLDFFENTSNTPAARPVLLPSLSKLNFADVSVGQSRQATFAIKNIGSAELVISNITITGASEFALLSPTTFPVTVGASENPAEAVISFAPTSPEKSNAMLSINSNDPGRPVFHINILGNSGTTFTSLETSSIVIDTDESLGGSWADYDNDGDDDLFVVNDLNQNVLYTNIGNGAFTRSTRIINSRSSQSSSWGDYDNDGDLDVFIARRFGQNQFFQNNGDGIFTEIKTGDIVNDNGSSRAGSWGDYDNDGFLDLFVANESNQNNFLYHNNKDGTFEKITTGAVVSDGAQSLACNWVDYDNDGYLDLFVANSSNDENFLYRNNHDGTFSRVEYVSPGINQGNSQSSSWGDYDNDGDPDLFIANSNSRNEFYRNNGNGTFERDTEIAFVSDPEFRNAFGSSWTDIDNDGDLDLFVTKFDRKNAFYQNNGDGSFTRFMDSIIASDSSKSRGNSWADFNRDGFLDLFVANDRGQMNALFKNEGNINHWINIKCKGVHSNTTGIGAKIRIKATIIGQSIWQLREISAQTGAGGHGSLNAAFGLREATIIDSLIIEWPSGIRQELTNVNVDQFLVIEERGTPTAIIDHEAEMPKTYLLDQNYPNPFNPETTIKYQLPKASQIKLEIVNILGQRVATLVDKEQLAGFYSVQWNGKDNSGRSVASGIYLYQLKAEDFVKVRKLTLLR